MCSGPEFASRLLDQWAHLNGVESDFSRPGRPTDNAHIEAFTARPPPRGAAAARGPPHIEAFNARLRAECLNASWFLSLADARDRLEAWRREYNEERPHGAWRQVPPPGVRDQG